MNPEFTYDLLELFLAQREEDPTLDFELWVLDYGDLRQELRRAWSDWQRASDSLERSAPHSERDFPP